MFHSPKVRSFLPVFVSTDLANFISTLWSTAVDVSLQDNDWKTTGLILYLKSLFCNFVGTLRCIYLHRVGTRVPTYNDKLANKTFINKN